MKKNPCKPAPHSFVVIYNELALPLTKFVMKRMGASDEKVEDIVEETVVAAWRGWNTFRHKSSYFTWLCRIALNKISDYYRDQVHKNSRIVVPLIEALTETDGKSLSPEEALALKELRKSPKNVSFCNLDTGMTCHMKRLEASWAFQSVQLRVRFIGPSMNLPKCGTPIKSRD